MRRTVLALLTFLAVHVPAAARDRPAPPPFATGESILQWINAYRFNKQPDLLPEAVKAASRLGLFRDLEAGGVYVGFMAGVLADNSYEAERLVARMFPLPPSDQVAIVRAIAYSGLADWKDLLRGVAERMPARQILIRRHLDDKLPTLEKLDLSGSPAALDTNWGFYFATGRTAAVDRIVAALAWTAEGDNLDRLTAGHMAKWTLANNALQDKDLLDHLKAASATRRGPVGTSLEGIIEAAETFETARIRKEAGAAIEQFKRKGPETQRQLSFWGQAGQTALALGCVVAGVLGHPEVAVPCVIGGAASTAALKVLTPQ